MNPTAPAAGRRGFTLIELLIAITIFLILGAATLAAVGAFREGDRVSGSARQVQSFVSGARDRAIYTNRTDAGPRPRGVRFLLNYDLLADLDADGTTEPFACTAMQYVEGAGFFPPGAAAARELGLTYAAFVFGEDPTNNSPGPGPFEVPELIPPGPIKPDASGQPTRFAAPDDVNNGGNEDGFVSAAELGAFGAGNVEAGWAATPLNRAFKAGLLGEPLPPPPGVAENANVRRQFLARVRLVADRSGVGRWYQALIESGTGTTEQARRLGNIRRVRLLTDPTGGSVQVAQNVNALAPEHGPVFELRTIPLAGEQPRPLPTGTAIDLASAARLGGLPASWQNASGTGPAGALDLMFDSAGLVTGDLAAAGLIHLPVVGTEDLDLGSNAFNGSGEGFAPGAFLPLEYTGLGGDRPAYDANAYVYAGPGKVGDSLVVTVSTQTGTVTVTEIDPTDAVVNFTGDPGPDGLADDPFFFAESGGEAAR